MYASHLEKIRDPYLKELLDVIPEIKRKIKENKERETLASLEKALTKYYLDSARKPVKLIKDFDPLINKRVKDFPMISIKNITTHFLNQLKILEDILLYNTDPWKCGLPGSTTPNYKEQAAVLNRVVEVSDYLSGYLLAQK
ncbi:hypothetical protein AYK26_05985 [Euryarchaeota archaeon SM23-78]|nr:MAG: hypothetical protein AYK26_05985 [Euryarchaeota archaeon SM23-78]